MSSGRPGVTAGGPEVIAGRPGVTAGGPEVVAGRPGVTAGGPGVIAGRPGVTAGDPEGIDGLRFFLRFRPVTEIDRADARFPSAFGPSSGLFPIEGAARPA